MANILTANELLQRKINSGHSVSLQKFNLEKPGVDTVKISSSSWEGTEQHAKLWNAIEDIKRKLPKKNSAAVYQNPSDLYDLVDKLRVDITRRAMAMEDYTSLICIEVTNPNFSEAVTLQEFYDYAAPFEKFAGTGDQVKLAQAKTGASEAVIMGNYGVGWAGRSLNDILYDTLFSLEKMNRAIAKGFALKRNDLVIGEIVGTTFQAAQKQAADTAGDTPEQKMYNTIDAAINKLGGLKDPQNKDQEIDASVITCLCNPADTRRINRAINGRIQAGGQNVNVDPLGEISTIIPYSSKTLYRGKETITYTGVTAGKAYLFVPNSAFYALNKRGLTTQEGPGNPLSFTDTQQGWYFTEGVYHKEFFGGSASGGTAGTGYIVEVTLPS